MVAECRFIVAYPARSDRTCSSGRGRYRGNVQCDIPEEDISMTRRRELRRLVEQKAGVVIPGVYDGVSAKLVERAGYPAVYMTGYGTSASRLGLPDLGYAGLAEMADHARNLAA